MRRIMMIIVAAMLLAGCADTHPTEPGDVAGEEWDLVWISTSAGWFTAREYADYLEEDLGVSITLYDIATGNLVADTVAEGLATNEGMFADRVFALRPDLTNAVDLFGEAEVVVIGLLDPSESLSSEVRNNWECLQEAPHNYVRSCSMEDMQPYFDDMRAIFEAVFTARDGQPTIVRAVDIWARPNWWAEDDPGDGEACRECWETFTNTFAAVAAEYNIPTLSLYDAWTGPDHTIDPEDLGYIGDDNTHPSQLGITAQADLLREIGYAYTWPNE